MGTSVEEGRAPLAPDNRWVRDLHSIPLFFSGRAAFSAEPGNNSWRPVVSASLTVDYQLAGGPHPAWFHVSTFLWFLAQLGTMFVLFRATLERARPGPGNDWVALFAAAIYGVHPAIADTVNYIIQRGDVYSTLGVTAGIALYAAAPGWRRYGLYLLPVVAGIFSKPPALVFPALLLVWIWLFEDVRFSEAARRIVPAFLVTDAAGYIVMRMTPRTFAAGALSPWLYRITQPAVLLGYFREFFLPTHLTADSDRLPFPRLLNAEALAGFVFVAALAAAAWLCTSRKETRPIAFGLFWFLIASAPTSLFALADVENDHRMYFPFVGLTLSVCWSAALAIARRPGLVRVARPVGALILIVLAWGTHERNKVWRTGASLWHDVMVKSPGNIRGPVGYGRSLMDEHDYAGALTVFEEALRQDPGYYLLEVNMGIAWAELADPLEAERHFLRGIELAPIVPEPRYNYALWLAKSGREPEAAEQLRLVLRQNPESAMARDLLLEIYAKTGEAAKMRDLARETLSGVPSNKTAAASLAPTGHEIASSGDAYARFVNDSGKLAQAGRYAECIGAARQALGLRPNSALAWNNLAFCHTGLKEWDDAMQAAQQAIRLDPGLESAKKNLELAQRLKSEAGAGKR